MAINSSKVDEEQKEALKHFDDAMKGISSEPKKKRGLFK